MANGRRKIAVRNIASGLLNNLVSFVMPFVTRTIIMYTIGVKYVGLNGLFSGILGVLGLMELGVGGAVTFCFFKPVAENDTAKINALLNFLKRCYRIIGMGILTSGILISPFLRHLIAGEPPEGINIYIIYYIYLINIALNYLLFAYKKVLFTAHQRYDIEMTMGSVLNLLQGILQILILLFLRNYYYFVSISMVIVFLNNVITACLVRKKYSQYTCRGLLDKETKDNIRKRIKGIFYENVGTVVLLSVDSIIISMFLGLEILGKYNNYYLIVSSLLAVEFVICNAIRPVITNCMVTDSKEKIYDDFKKFGFIYMSLASFFSLCSLCLYQSFIFLWLGTDLMLPDSIVYLLVISLYVQSCCHMPRIYKEAAGIAFEGRFVPLAGAACNLLLNVVLVKVLGLEGIVVATILSVTMILFFGYLYILFKHYFKTTKWIGAHLMRYLKYTGSTLATALIVYPVSGLINPANWFCFLLKALLCAGLSLGIYLLLHIKDPDLKMVLRELPAFCKVRKLR